MIVSKIKFVLRLFSRKKENDDNEEEELDPNTNSYLGT